MKVLALVVLVVASASGKGSGPYLPSGWRPQGPAFYLPSEKPSENPLKDVILAGSEASGSDFLREYGPPKVQEISQNLINQGLPDVVTEQTFDFVPVVPIVVEEVKKEAVVETAAENTEAKTEQTATEQSEATTEAALEEKAISVDLPIIEVESIVETSKTTLADGVETTNTNVEYTQFQNVDSSESSSQSVEFSQQSSQTSESSSQQSSQESFSSNVQVSNVERIVSEQASEESVNQQESVLSEESATSASEAQSDVTEKSEEAVVTLEQAQNIPDIIANLEKEIKAQQPEVTEAVSEVAIQPAGAVEQAPEGFLEYGPPGFAEYGPPKGANEDNTASFEYTNETRRRRFSPKFKSSKKH